MSYSFLIDTNLPIDTDDDSVASVLRDFDVSCDGTTDLSRIGREIRAHKPDIGLIPLADWHRSLRRGDDHYSGLVISTSKFTGSTTLPSVLVVSKDDPAESIMDLEGASYGYINTSCTSSYFPPIVMLHKRGIAFDDFLDGKPVKAWQGQIDAVTDGEVRATMVPDDVWRTTPENAEKAKVIDRFDDARPALVVARRDLEPKLRSALAEALISWATPWSAPFGCYRPFLRAEVHNFFHELDQLPADT